VKARTYGYYNRLLLLGGRPSAEIQPDPGVWDPSIGGDKELHVLHHWWQEGGRCYAELCRWEKFIEYQKSVRKDLETFLKYVDDVSWYQQRRGIEESLHPHLELQPDRQTKLNEWKEYYLYEHRKLGPLEREVRRTQLALKSAQERLAAARTEKLREDIEHNMPIHEGRVGGAKMDVKEHETLLQRIKQQLPLIASSRHRNGNKEFASHLAPSDSKPNISGQQLFKKKKHLKAPSVLSPIKSAKVSKVNQKRPLRAKLSTRNDSDDPDLGRGDQTVSSQVTLRRSARISRSTMNVQAPTISNLRRSARLSEKSGKPVRSPKNADPIASFRSDPRRRPRDTANTRSSAKPQGVTKTKRGKGPRRIRLHEDEHKSLIYSQ
jgi:hypothetical protein